MKRKIQIMFPLVVLLLVNSCKEKEEYTCPAPMGQMTPLVNDSIELAFRWVYFLDFSSTEFADSWTDSSINISADFINAGCVKELSIEFLNIDKSLGEQRLISPVYDENNPLQYKPSSIFYTWNVDALTERFLLIESEPAWISLDKISDKEVRGSFQGTYVYRPSPLRFWEFPDTLRFNDVTFKAKLFDPPELD